MFLPLTGRKTVFLALLLSVGLGEGCANSKAGARPDGLEPGGTVITRAEIEGMRVRTAMDVVERGAKHLLIQRTREGSPARIYHRGVDSIYLDAEMHVVVDGMPVSFGVGALKDILASNLESIQILSAREATTKFGAVGGAGVILVRTTAG